MLNIDLRPGNVITVTPQGKTMFKVVAVDDLSDDMVYVHPEDPSDERPAQWVFTTYARIVDDKPK
jgi:hypothetical protein